MKNDVEKLLEKYPVYTTSQIFDYFKKNKPTTLGEEVKENLFGKKVIIKGKIFKKYLTKEEVRSKGKAEEVIAISSVGFGGPSGITFSSTRNYLIGNDTEHAMVINVPNINLKEGDKIIILGKLRMTKENVTIECFEVHLENDK